MKLLYFNNELAVADGCNAHALGMLNAMKKLIGEENIFTYPKPQDCSAKQENKNIVGLKDKFASALQVVRYYRKSIKSITLANQLYKEMQLSSFMPTHIWVRSSVFETTAVRLAKKTGAKLICEMNTPFYYEWCITRQLPLRNKVERWERNLLKEADYIYVVSEKLKDMYVSYYGISGKKILTIPNGFDKELYADWTTDYKKIRSEIRKKEKIDNKFVVTFIGSLKVWHGINRFCEVADALKDYQNIHFMVLGDGEMRKLIEDYVKSHANMSFAGKLDYTTMKKYIYASDLGIMPYTVEENFYFSPLKMYDMMGGHLPFVGTNVGQISDVCTEMLCSDFLTNENSTEALIMQLKTIIENPYIYANMKRVVDEKQKEFTWDKRAEMLIEALK